MKAEDGQRHIADAPTLLFVGGEWREAGDRRRFDVIDPATECVLAQVADGNVDDARAAVDAAARALPAWSARTPRERAEVLRNAYQIRVAQCECIARLITLENGNAFSCNIVRPVLRSSSRRGTSRRQWAPARSRRPWPPAVRWSSNPPPSLR